MTTVLERDDVFAGGLPRCTVVPASAGSGKTTELTRRMVQLLLSTRIPSNALKNILAITFTNNAALEMKHRVLETLKKASLGDRDQLEDLSRLLSASSLTLRQHAAVLVDQLLEDYSDFQIQTIDSFLARVFKASALEFGLTPDFDIVLSGDELLRGAFEKMMSEVSAGSSSAALFDDLVTRALSSRGAGKKYIWNPSEDLFTTVKDLYGRLMQHTAPLNLRDDSAVLRKTTEELSREILALAEALRRLDLVPKYLDKALDAAGSKNAAALCSAKISEIPYKVSGVPEGDRKRAKQATAKIIRRIWKRQAKLCRLLARQYYQSYAAAFSRLEQYLRSIRIERGSVDISEVSRGLARYMEGDVVPEVYYKLGEHLRHFLIDEFQDTAPIQWRSLKPLIENSLSGGGSLFVVGDPKQSIYMFRGADWRIMNELQKRSVFPMAPPDIKELGWNYRSGERIVEFNREVFQTIVPAQARYGGETISGLAHFVQEVPEDLKGKGHVEVHVVPQDAPAGRSQERELLLGIIADCRARGFMLKDIAVLTPKNRHVVDVSSWLNEQGIEFISHSSLDIRTRKVTAELLSLLRFLDTPIDDLAIVSFLLGDIFRRALAASGADMTVQDLRTFVRHWSDERPSPAPAYRRFRETFPDVWERYFQRLFALVGYLSLYDLTAEVLKTFAVFDTLPEEEAALVKLLEVVKNMEEGGSSSLKEFLQSSGESSEDRSWDIDVPADTNAVRLMTTHKAKGLGFRVVAALLYDAPHRSDPLYVAENPDGVELLRLVKEAEEVEGLSDLYGEKKQREEADFLNQLYVLFTRAREELYVLCVESPRKEISRFLPRDGYQPGGAKPGVETIRPGPERRAPLYHHHRSVRMRREPGRKLAIEETARGEFVHDVLARIEFVEPDVPRQVRAAVNAVAARTREVSLYDPEAIAHTLERFLVLPALSGLFSRKEGRSVLNEQEFADRSGRLFRMDRVVVDTDAVTVIDFKTGGMQEGYEAQVVTYRKILRDVFAGKQIRGILAFVDRLSAVEVEEEDRDSSWEEDPWSMER